MKPCSPNRAKIAWLALGALERAQAEALRQHLARCAACRRYWEELSSLTEQLTAAAPDPGLEATESFHRRVARKLEAVGPDSILAGLAAWFRRPTLDWRFAALVMALVVVVFALWVGSGHDAGPRAPGAPVVRAAWPVRFAREEGPTLANYQRVSIESLAKLDERLTQEGNAPLPPAPLYTSVGLVDLAVAGRP